MSKSRKIKIDKNYKPLPTNEGDNRSRVLPYDQPCVSGQAFWIKNGQ